MGKINFDLINQNAKFDQEFINTFEPDFTFSDKPINRFNISSNNTTKNTLDKTEKLFKPFRTPNQPSNTNFSTK
mgnify:CR=1 FL=1